MTAIIRRFDGEDIVISRDELFERGVRPGPYVAIRPMQRVVLSLPVQTAAPQPLFVAGRAWLQTALSEEIDAECENEESWERWSQRGA